LPNIPQAEACSPTLCGNSICVVSLVLHQGYEGGLSETLKVLKFKGM